MSDLIERLEDLHKQATTERSHFYVASCVKDSIAEIRRLRMIEKAADLYLYCSRTYGAQAQESINSGNQLADTMREIANEVNSGIVDTALSLKGLGEKE